MMDPKYRDRLRAMDSLLLDLRNSGDTSPEALASAAVLALAELVQAFTDLATDLDALEWRIKAVEHQD